ncbi:Ribosomal RNA small subunit methyltransferase A [Limihaloglobus sulfuriphilus]|uniref:Ribosomal RNA small subunit methyltransferase A n=1 Tax=Limihaloglobus sulfuriphilus TaxID=1851148 RepID=A0A1Q2MF35_9BACT|nr:16S rRNA (adenine(1518)-N(6)/adenine(1519)-N(6))-dimethyltransferase RsmA [Limihaloglobus sulfuriphilus]AQQ71269.1 Ribosomal RNA small subunit methyltransferase A [Limihaloglobus sulfuriphilus]
MQTKQEIQALLAGVAAVPNHRLGQNFLIDKNLLEFLLQQASVTADDIVFEVGCGTGTLSQDLSERAGAVVIVEYDRLMCRITAGVLAGRENVTMINADALDNKNKVNLEAMQRLAALRRQFKGRLMLIANLPYQIAASLMCNLVTAEPVFDAMYITVQKEVAQRMSAGAGDKHYGILSILMQAAGNVKLLRKLGPDVFWPAPKVESAMVSYVRDEGKCSLIENPDILKRLISVFMGHRRKMMKACVKFVPEEFSGINEWDSLFETARINPQDRPEKVRPEQYVELANAVSQRLK